jgi:ribosome-associated translation inhibitor RaiA
MSRLKRFRRTGRRFVTAAQDFAASLADTGPSEDFKIVIKALGNLKKAEVDFKLTKESDLEKMVFAFASQSQTQIDPDALLAWKQSILAAEAKRADLLGAFDLAEDEFSALAKEFAKRDTPALLKAIDELFELLQAAKTGDGSQGMALVHAEDFLHGLKKTAERSVSGKKPVQKKVKKPKQNS